MSAVLFDTLRLSRTLRDKGHFTAEQAEALAEALGEAAQGDLATKSELHEVELRIEAKMESHKADLLKRVIGAIGFQTLVILGALVSLTKVLAK